MDPPASDDEATLGRAAVGRAADVTEGTVENFPEGAAEAEVIAVISDRVDPATDRLSR